MPYKFIIQLVYKGLKGFLTRNIDPTLDKHVKLTRWQSFIHKFDCEAEHIQRKDIVIVDQQS
jgi:hypothetical protein